MPPEQDPARPDTLPTAETIPPTLAAGAVRTSASHRRWLWLGILLALIVGTTLRLGLRPWIWWVNADEGFYYQAATATLGETTASVIRSNAHPPLHYWLLRWAAPHLADPVDLRYLSLLAGLLTIVAAGWLAALAGAEAGGERGRVVGGWIGAIGVALAPGLLVQSVTLRPYALCLCFLTFGLGALLRFADTGHRRWLPLLSLAFTVSVLELYASFLVVASVALAAVAALGLGRLSWRRFLGLVGAGVPVFAAMLWLYLTHLRPHVLGMPIHAWAKNTWLTEQFPQNPFDVLPLLYAAAAHAYTHLLAWLVFLAALLAAGLAVATRRGLSGLLVLAMSMVAGACSVAGLYPLGESRHSLHLAPVYLAGAASGIGWLLSRLAAPATSESTRRRGLRRALLLALGLAGLLPVALHAARILRQGQAAVLGPTRMELTVPRSSVAVVADFLRGLPALPCLMDLQTAELLMPLAAPHARTLAAEPGFGVTAFAILGQKCAVIPEWTFSQAFLAPGPSSFDHALVWLRSTHAGEVDPRVAIVAGGTGVSDVYRLQRELAAQREQGFPAAGDAHLAGVVLEISALEAWQERHRPSP